MSGAAPVDRYAVIGNPVAHSRSPFIHAQFAAQTGERLEYGRLLSPLDGFGATVAAFRAEGGRGLNVTVPFKEQAFALATRCTPRAQAAGAVNTLRFDGADALGDNTDGVGLVRDLVGRHGLALSGMRVLLLGAGGAARGVLAPLLDAGVEALWIANRTVARAEALCALAADRRCRALPLQALADAGSGDAAAARSGSAGAAPASVDLIVNATAAGLADAAVPIAGSLLARTALVYDMLYGPRPTRFMEAAMASGAPRVVDGLGMLVEQAAESFCVWRGCLPDTRPVYEALRALLEQPPRQA